MVEQVVIDKFPFINSLQVRREQLRLNGLDIELLKAQAGSQDPHLAQEAQRVLRIKWDLDPSRDTLNAKSIDIMEQFSIFSKKEIDMMLSNIVAIQLTEGCNGNCPFCVFGKKEGVKEKYSFSSLKTFFSKYAYILADHPFLFYWDSDPFDYRDGERSFIDVYRLYLETSLPYNYHYISTAVPKGSVSNYIDFMHNTISDQSLRDKDGQPLLHVRLSVAQHNIQRIESAMIELTKFLLSEGYTQREINEFYQDFLSTVDRNDDNLLLPIGPFRRRADDIRDTYSVLCRDGVVIAPNSFNSVMMTTPTIYEPTGHKRIDLLPGQAEAQIPKKVREEFYSTFRYGEKTLLVRTKRKQMILETIKRPNGEEYTLPNKFEDLSLKLSREVASISRLIMDFSKLAWLEANTPDPQKEKQNFAVESVKTFREREKYTQKLIATAELYCQQNTLSGDEQEMIEYYITLTKVYLAEMSFLAGQSEGNQPIFIISIMANILRQVGRNEVTELPNILEGLVTLGNELQKINIDLSKINRSVIKSFFRDKFTMSHQQSGKVAGNLTAWFLDLSSKQNH